MQLRNRGGGITPAEGCMFAAVALFVILLLTILYIAFMRFGNPPAASPTRAPEAAMVAPAQDRFSAPVRVAPLPHRATHAVTLPSPLPDV